MSTQWRSLGRAALVGLGIVACSSGSSSNFSSGVDSSKQMSQLTSSELDQVCTSALDFVRKDDAVKQVACKTLTLPTAVSGGTDACKTAYNQCLASDAGISIPDAGTTNGSASGCSVPALCTATVGDYQNCVTDVRKQLDTLNSEFKVCDLNSAVNLDGAVAAQPASCTALDEKCPGILQTAVPSTTP